MINTFLKAKHWQLGLALIAPVILVQILIHGTSLFYIEEGREMDPSPFFNLLTIIPLISLFLMFIILGWFWSISIGLQSKLPEHLKMKTKAFKIFNIYPGLYIGCFSIFMISAPLNELFMESLEYVQIFFLIIPFHLFAMFCMFYSMYFTAKTLKMVELQRKVSFGDYVGEIFFLWISFIGVWIIQPRVNKLVNQRLPENHQA